MRRAMTNLDNADEAATDDTWCGDDEDMREVSEFGVDGVRRAFITAQGLRVCSWACDEVVKDFPTGTSRRRLAGVLKWESTSVHGYIRTVLSVYIGDAKVAGPEACMKKTWSLIHSLVGIYNPTTLGKHLGCGQEKLNSVFARYNQGVSGTHSAIVVTAAQSKCMCGRTKRWYIGRCKGILLPERNMRSWSGRGLQRAMRRGCTTARASATPIPSSSLGPYQEPPPTRVAATHSSARSSRRAPNEWLGSRVAPAILGIPKRATTYVSDDGVTTTLESSRIHARQ